MDEATTLSQLTFDHWLVRLAVATGIGFLVGLEREFAKQVRDPATHGHTAPEKQFAGLRTYTLIAVFGFMAASLTRYTGEWFLGASFLGFIALVISAYLLTGRDGEVGATTEITAIITFLLGALCFEGELLMAVGIAVFASLLLSFKLPLHRFVTTLTEQDIRAIIQFVIISALVLPFLPDEGYGPYGVWNPKEIWAMVVLVSGISLVGYLLTKVLGPRKGTLVAGTLGGLVSSTAVALSFARKAREGHAPAPHLAVSIVAASSIMFPRMLLEMLVVNDAMAVRLWPMFALVTAAGFTAAYLLLRRQVHGEPAAVAVLTNPLNFRVALQFALLYAAVGWLIAWAGDHFGHAGTYAAGALIGATDVDAITLRMARAARDVAMEQPAMITILLASMVNTLAKYAIVLVVGNAPIRRMVTPGFAALFLMATGCVLWLALQ